MPHELRTLARRLLGLGILCTTAPGHAAVPCSFEHSYPEVSALDVTDGRLVATLGGRFAPADAGDAAIRVALADDGTWRILTDAAPPSAPTAIADAAATDAAIASTATAATDTPPECPAAPIDEDWLRSERMNPSRREVGFQQRVTACAADGPTQWGALAFSTIDGSNGGGLFEHEAGSEDYDFWRPVLLARYSISRMAFANDALWIDTAQEGECKGTSPGFGIYRIDVRDARRRDYTYAETGVCGFAARDMAVHDGRLWIATELGLARLDGTSAEGTVWQNFLPDPASPELMRPMTCDAIYEAVLNMPNMYTDEAFDLGFAFDDFWKRLSRLRPEFFARYLRKLHGR